MLPSEAPRSDQILVLQQEYLARVPNDHPRLIELGAELDRLLHDD
jgi:hypothetical protein